MSFLRRRSASAPRSNPLARAPRALVERLSRAARRLAWSTAPRPDVQYRERPGRVLDAWCLEVRLDAESVGEAAARAFVGRQTLRELRVRGLDAEDREVYALGVEDPAAFVYAPAGELPDLDPTFLETATWILGAEGIDGLWLGDASSEPAPTSRPTTIDALLDPVGRERAVFALRGFADPLLPWTRRARRVGFRRRPSRVGTRVAQALRLARRLSILQLSAGRRLVVKVIDGGAADDATTATSGPSRRRRVVSLAAGRDQRCGSYLLRTASPWTVGRRIEIPIHDARRLRRLPARAVPAGNRRPLLVTVPFFARGGAEHTLFETLRALGDRWRPLFVSLAPHSAELGDRRDEFRQLSAHLLSLGDWVHPAAMPGILLGLIEGHGVAHWYNANGTTLFYDFAPRLRAERPSPRVIDHLYDHEIGYIDRYLQPQAGFEPQAHVDAIVAENHRIHDVLCARGWPTERVPTIWPCGRSTDAFAPEERRPAVRTALRRELGYSDDAVVVLTAARMHPQKRPLDLVALAQRLQDAPRLHWLVVGGGPLEAEMDAAIASAPAARIRRLPFRTDIPDLLLACDAGALVSAYEGLPVFFLEALQAGRPFLGTAVGDLGVLLRDTGAGWLVETPGDLDALEAAARRLLDDAERAAKGRRAAEVAPAFAVEACAERYDRAFRGAPARPSGSRTPVPTEDRPTGVLPGWTARTRAESLFWHLARGWRPAARRARRAAAILRRRVLRGEPWVVDRPTAPRPQREPGSTTHPAVLLEGAVDASVLAAHRAAQTETALVATDAPSASTAGWLWLVDGDPGDLPSAAAEAALLAATVEDLPLVLVGEGASAAAPKALLWRAPNGGRSRVDGRAGRVIARRLPLVGFEPVTASDDVEADAPRPGRRRLPLFRQAGPHWLRFDVGSRIVHRPLRDAVTSLAALPEVDGPRTALFLMPFLAVGGAERLLDDLIAGLDPASRRILIVTTEPHDRQLGQTVDRFRALTPHVYTLGDWLPRAAHAGVLRHLIRRWRVESVVSWNGTVLFYDEAVSLSRMTPRPRLLAQLYHHRGAWAARTTSAIASAIDVHLAVQPEIARALVAERGLAPKRVAVVPHGVEVPSSATDADDRRRLRAALGLPADALVLGAFVRLHPQKRPLDLVRLARRLATDDVWLLLIGGGPLEEDLEAELARRPVANLVRLPMVPDARPFYAALDLCVLTSAYEGLPVFLLDGLARGLPAVATAVGDIPELLASGCGDTVPIGDLEAMAAAVLRRRDPELRRREGEQGRNTVAERWGLDAYRMRYDRLIFPARAEPSDEESPAVTGVAVAPRIEPRRNEAPRTEPPSPEPPSPEPPSPEPSSSEPTAPASPSQRIHGSAPALIRSPDRRAIGTSVVIPSYQHERYIEEAVRSALASDAVDEVVVLDDGSTDDSVPRLRALSDPRLRVDVQSNAGAHVALDRAIEQSRGEVIFILNSDDVFEPERVTALRQAFEDPAVVVAASWLRLIDDDGREIGLKHGWHDLPPWPRPHAGPGIDDLDDPALALLASNWVSTTSNVAVRRRLIDAGVRFRPLRYAHDWAFLLEACERGELAVVPKPLVRYRVHASNTIKEGADQRPTGRGEERGRARMRFEILWLLARHAATLTAQAAERGVASHDELEARLWRSVPRFGAEEGLLALLALRGTGAAVPAVYDRLLEPDSTMARRLRDLLVTP